MGALDPWARSTIATIWARAVSRPTRVARMTTLPVVLSVAPMTVSPGALSTGIGSPVSIDSSTADRPSTTTPSTGTLAPGRTRRRSPGRTWSRGISRSRSAPARTAWAGWRSRRSSMAPVVRAFARASSHRPSRTSPMIRADESKYASVGRPMTSSCFGKTVATTDQPHAALVPRATRVSMFAAPCRSARQADV